ncbi:hypothetical protein X975_07910, partial [Stegodyphus mimosarum]
MLLLLCRRFKSASRFLTFYYFMLLHCQKKFIFNMMQAFLRELFSHH